MINYMNYTSQESKNSILFDKKFGIFVTISQVNILKIINYFYFSTFIYFFSGDDYNC
jgi:hypothetical protein